MQEGAARKGQQGAIDAADTALSRTRLRHGLLSRPQHTMQLILQPVDFQPQALPLHLPCIAPLLALVLPRVAPSAQVGHHMSTPRQLLLKLRLSRPAFSELCSDCPQASQTTIHMISQQKTCHNNSLGFSACARACPRESIVRKTECSVFIWTLRKGSRLQKHAHADCRSITRRTLPCKSAGPLRSDRRCAPHISMRPALSAPPRLLEGSCSQCSASATRQGKPQMRRQMQEYIQQLMTHAGG